MNESYLITELGREQYRKDMIEKNRKAIDGFLRSMLGESEMQDRVIKSLIEKNNNRDL